MLISGIKSTSRGKTIESTAKIQSKLRNLIIKLELLLIFSLNNNNLDYNSNNSVIISENKQHNRSVLEGEYISIINRIQLILQLNSNQLLNYEILQENFRLMLKSSVPITATSTANHLNELTDYQKLLLLQHIIKMNHIVAYNDNKKSFMG